MSKPKNKQRACDVLNWDCLVELSQYSDPAATRDTTEIIGVFAYTITKTGDEDERDRILTNLLRNSTYGSRPDDNEIFLLFLAGRTKSELEPLRKFAKQVGVRLKRSFFGLTLVF